MGVEEPEIVIVDSARKRGHSDEDILHAYRTAFRLVEPSDEDEDFAMVLGYTVAGNILEIGYVRGNRSTATRIVHVIVHAMKARPGFLH